MPGSPDSIATDRLDLVPLTVADAGALVAVLADPALYAYIGGAPPSRADLVRRFRAQVAGRSPDGREAWHNWIVRERVSGAATGYVQATIAVDGPAPGEIAWMIGTPWQGRGYATEAARALVAWLEESGVRLIVAHIHPDHGASAAVAERAGLAPTDELVEGERVWRLIPSAVD